MKLIEVINPQLDDVENIVSIDREVIGNNSRKAHIKRAVEEGRCIAVKHEKKIAGFLIFNTSFFDCNFISLIIVSPTERRKGLATALIEYFVNISSTRKVFSSTNQSNEDMQKVFLANGFVQSGMVENLDEGDPEIIYFKSK